MKPLRNRLVGCELFTWEHFEEPPRIIVEHTRGYLAGTGGRGGGGGFDEEATLASLAWVWWDYLLAGSIFFGGLKTDYQIPLAGSGGSHLAS